LSTLTRKSGPVLYAGYTIVHAAHCAAVTIPARIRARTTTLYATSYFSLVGILTNAYPKLKNATTDNHPPARANQENSSTPNNTRVTDGPPAKNVAASSIPTIASPAINPDAINVPLSSARCFSSAVRFAIARSASHFINPPTKIADDVSNGRY